MRDVTRLSYLLSEINILRKNTFREKFKGDLLVNRSDVEKCRCFLRIIAREFRLNANELL